MSAAARKQRSAVHDDGKDAEFRTVAENRRAFHDYAFSARYEAGVALQGTEIKSIRAGHVTLREGFVRIVNEEAWLVGVHIAPYEQGSYLNHDPTRQRRLLLHKAQLRELGEQTRDRGVTIIPLRLYLKRGRAKVEIGVGRGKRQYDKRQAIAERDAQREIERALRSRERR